MDQCLEEMRKLPTETLLNIINKERFEHKPEEVRAALYVLNERNVQYEYLSNILVILPRIHCIHQLTESSFKRKSTDR